MTTRLIRTKLRKRVDSDILAAGGGGDSPQASEALIRGSGGRVKDEPGFDSSPLPAECGIRPAMRIKYNATHYTSFSPKHTAGWRAYFVLVTLAVTNLIM